MPHDPQDRAKLEAEAETLLHTLLGRYLELNLHHLDGGDLEIGAHLEEIFHAQREVVLDLVIAGLRHTDPPFL